MSFYFSVAVHFLVSLWEECVALGCGIRCLWVGSDDIRYRAASTTETERAD